MRNISRTIKKALNESIETYNEYYTQQDLINSLGLDDIDPDCDETVAFEEITKEAMNLWYSGDEMNNIPEIGQAVAADALDLIEIDTDRFPTYDDLWDYVTNSEADSYYFDKYNQLLYDAVKDLAPGDDWWEVGKALGIDPNTLDELYASDQSKYDPLNDACESWYPEDEEDEEY